MNKILLALVAGVMIGAFTVSQAQAPAKPAAAKPAAEAPKGPSADEKAQERAVANYRKNKGMAMEAKKPAAKKK